MIILMLMQIFTIIIPDMHPSFGYHLHVLTLRKKLLDIQVSKYGIDLVVI